MGRVHQQGLPGGKLEKGGVKLVDPGQKAAAQRVGGDPAAVRLGEGGSQQFLAGLPEHILGPAIGQIPNGIKTSQQILPVAFGGIALAGVAAAHADDGNRFVIGGQGLLLFLHQLCGLLQSGPQVDRSG